MSPEETTHTTFFYGTLMVPSILHRVIQNPAIALPSSHITTSPALLPTFRRYRVRHADYPAILPSNDDGACVKGTLVRGLSDGDMARLDRFEGGEYARRGVEVDVLSESGTDVGKKERRATVEAETYVWIAGEEQLEAGEWDFDEFRKEKLWRWVGSGSTEYQDVEDGEGKGGGSDEADPTRGRGPDGSIGKALEEDRGKAEEMLESAV